MSYLSGHVSLLAAQAPTRLDLCWMSPLLNRMCSVRCRMSLVLYRKFRDRTGNEDSVRPPVTAGLLPVHRESWSVLTPPCKEQWLSFKRLWTSTIWYFSVRISHYLQNKQMNEKTGKLIIQLSKNVDIACFLPPYHKLVHRAAHS